MSRTEQFCNRSPITVKGIKTYLTDYKYNDGPFLFISFHLDFRLKFEALETSFISFVILSSVRRVLSWCGQVWLEPHH